MNDSSLSKLPPATNYYTMEAKPKLIYSTVRDIWTFLRHKSRLLHFDIHQLLFQLSVLYFVTQFRCGICYLFVGLLFFFPKMILSFQQRLASCSHQYDYIAYGDGFSFSSAHWSVCNMFTFVFFAPYGSATGWVECMISYACVPVLFMGRNAVVDTEVKFVSIYSAPWIEFDWMPRRKKKLKFICQHDYLLSFLFTLMFLAVIIHILF